VLRNGNFRTRWFDAAVERLRARDSDFPRVTPHDLRHTAASLAVSAGANVKAVQRMLGHASASMTLDVYTDLFDDDLDGVAAALDQQVRKSGASDLWPHSEKVDDPPTEAGAQEDRRTEGAPPTLW
jgi:hypothetical protein